MTKIICTHEGGAKQAVKGGVYVRHGAALRPKRLHEGFANQAKVGGVCLRHGTTKPCRHEGGTNPPVRKQGVRIRHGAVVANITCTQGGGASQARVGETVCLGHGAP